MTSDHTITDETNLAMYIDWIDRLTRGEYQFDHMDEPSDRLGRSLYQLAHTLEKQSEQQKKNLQELTDAKNTFLSVAAHDLRSPLGIIEMATSIFDEPGFELTQEELAVITTNISIQARHMRNLLDNLLDLSRIERGKVELLPKLVDLSEFLTRLVADHNQLAGSKGSTVHLKSELDASDIIRADPIRLRQAADNLISNALKFSPPGSQVDVIAKRTETGWRIAVKDEGPGLTTEDRAQLFQPFKRLSAKPTGDERGSGIGLAITRYIIESHKGTIGVDTEPGNGTQFWITLPTGGVDA